MSPEKPLKKNRVTKTVTVDPEIARAANAAVEAGLAKDFSDAIEKGLRLLLRSEGFPEKLTENDLRTALAAKPIHPDKGEKKSGETKYSRGALVAMDPEIEKRRVRADRVSKMVNPEA